MLVYGYSNGSANPIADRSKDGKSFGVIVGLIGGSNGDDNNDGRDDGRETQVRCTLGNSIIKGIVAKTTMKKCERNAEGELP